jgi:hypothetical protein
LWGAAELAAEIKVEISSRMTRSLGRCYADRKLIRIARFVAEESDELFEEVLCHEAAHVAAYHLHGRSIRPHGREWKTLVQAAGYEPSVKYKGSLPSPSLPKASMKTSCSSIFEGVSTAFFRKLLGTAFKKSRS